MVDRAVVVTGASTGIGEACALHLDRLGFRVFAGVRSDGAAEALKGKASERLAPVNLDVTDGTLIASAARRVEAAVGKKGLQGLVNNAGIALAGPLEFLPVDALRQQLEVNVIGQIAVTQAFLPLLRAGTGRIVNIGSISGRLATPFLGPYTASKFALEALTDALRGELQPWGIHVSIVEPSGIATPIWQKSLAAADQLLARLPPQVNELYGPAITRMRKIAARSGETGMPADVVARAVAHALTVKNPKTRYAVGRGARLTILIAKFVPDRLRDRIIASQLRAARPRRTTH